jgi:glycosyltransferase involved in cell wall biosynthesis
VITDYSISVIFPLYNEAEIVEEALLTLVGFFRESFRDWEIVVVESGSTDRSAEICDRLAREHEHIRVFHQEEREGFGSGVKLGYANALMDLIWVIPPDICFPLDSIFRAIPLLEDHDCVLSYRSDDPRSLLRRINSLGFNTLVKTVFRLKQKHVNSALKVFKADLIKSLPLHSNGWFLDTEILIELRKRKVRYAEIPVALIDRTSGESTIKPASVTAMLREMFDYLRHHYRG